MLSGKLACCLAAMACLVLAGCGAGPVLEESRWTDRLTPRTGRDPGAERSSGTAVALGSERRGKSFTGFEVSGRDRLLEADAADRRLALADDGEKVTLNLLDAPVEAAAKAILGDILAVNYSVDGRVQGQVTIQTAKPISKTELAQTFNAILRSNGASLIETGGFYRIVPLAEAARAGKAIAPASQAGDGPGLQTLAIPLRFVSPDEIRTVLEPIMPEGAVIRVDRGRNAIVVSGSALELQAMRETIAVFDVDWMAGMSFGLYPVKSADPSAIARELETVFSSRAGPLKGVVRFMPNKRLNSILVISARSRYLKDAASWIARLDRAARTSEASLHVYNVQNRSAAELAGVLQKVYRPETGGAEAAAPPAAVAPRLEPAVIAEGSGKADLLPAGEAAGETAIPEDAEAPEAPGRFDAQRGIGIVADDANNSLLIISTDDEFERMLRILAQVDSMPNQVMLEATIAEVALTDELRFGVRWFFGGPDSRSSFTDLASGAVASSFPGFSYVFASGNDIRLSLNALAAVTRVHVLSSPTLMVLDNRTASLQVGDQVPVISQQATSVAAPGAPVVNTVELKDTGVILSVTPRVNDSGKVVLDIKQEVSDVIPTQTSGIDSPTIRQRKIATTVVVNDGDTLALGGLIQERNSTGRTKVPLLGELPFLGAAFRAKRNAIERTELVIFIRPRVVRDVSQARSATGEFRRQMSIEAPLMPKARTQMGRDLVRIAQ